MREEAERRVARERKALGRERIVSHAYVSSRKPLTVD
jgi:hypothetical protein